MAFDPTQPFEVVEEPQPQAAASPRFDPAQPFEVVQEEGSGILRQAADIPVNIGSGVITGLKGLTDLAGADNPASQTLAGYQKFYQDLLSPEAKADQQRVAAIMREAQDQGIPAQVMAGAKAFTVAPLDTLANAAGTMAPAIATGVAGKAIGLGAKGIQAAQVAMGAGQGAGFIKGGIYDATKQYLLEQGVDADAAEKAASQAQAYNGGNLDQILLGAGLGAAATGIGVERIIGKAIGGGVKDASKNIVTAGIKAAVQEGVPEAAQGGQEQLAQNLALIRQGANIPAMRGVVSQATLEGLAGMAAGGPVGIADYVQTPDMVQRARQAAAAPASFVPTPEVDPALVAQEFGDVTDQQQPANVDGRRQEPPTTDSVDVGSKLVVEQPPAAFPVQLTLDQEQELAARGYTQDEIAMMSPQDAAGILQEAAPQKPNTEALLAPVEQSAAPIEQPSGPPINIPATQPAVDRPTPSFPSARPDATLRTLPDTDFKAETKRRARAVEDMESKVWGLPIEEYQAAISDPKTFGEILRIRNEYEQAQLEAFRRSSEKAATGELFSEMLDLADGQGREGWEDSDAGNRFALLAEIIAARSPGQRTDAALMESLAALPERITQDRNWSEVKARKMANVREAMAKVAPTIQQPQSPPTAGDAATVKLYRGIAKTVDYITGDEFYSASQDVASEYAAQDGKQGEVVETTLADVAKNPYRVFDKAEAAAALGIDLPVTDIGFDAAVKAKLQPMGHDAVIYEAGTDFEGGGEMEVHKFAPTPANSSPATGGEQSAATTGEPLIFGRPFREIVAMQQGERPAMLRPVDALKHAEQIVRDIERFKIPVAEDVAKAYGITLPKGYTLQGGTYVYQQPEAAQPAAQTQQGAVPSGWTATTVSEPDANGNPVTVPAFKDKNGEVYLPASSLKELDEKAPPAMAKKKGETPPLGVAPMVPEMIGVLRRAASDFTAKISNVKHAGFENSREVITFDFDGKPHRGVLRGRNRDLVVGMSPQADQGIASRVLLDGDATPVGESKAASSKTKARIRKNLKPNSGAVDLDIINDLVDYGRQFYRAGMTFGKWAGQMVAEFGQGVARYLQDAFNRIVQAYKDSPYSSEAGSVGDVRPGRFAQRAAESPALAPEVRAASGTEYIPIHLMPLAEDAKAWVNSNGLDAGLTRILKLRSSSAPTPTPLDFTIGIEIAGRLSAVGRHDDAAAVVNSMSERATSLGQTISVLSMLNQLTPEGITAYANNIIDEHVDKLPQAQKDAILTARRDAADATTAYETTRTNASNDAILNTTVRGEKIKDKIKDATTRRNVNVGIRGILAEGKPKAEAIAEVAAILTANGISNTDATALATSIVGKVYGVLTNARRQLAKDLANKHSWRVRGHKKLLERFMDGEMSNEQFIANITAMAGLPSVSRADAARWNAKLDQFKAATDEDIKMVLMGQIFEDIHSILPPEFWGQVRAFSYLAMLFYPLTWIKNIGGNTILWLANAGRDSIVNGVDLATSTVTKKRSTGGVSAKTRLKSLATPFYDVKRGWEWNAQQYPGASRLQNLKAGLEHLRVLSKLTTQNKWDITDAKEAGRRMFSSKFMRGWEASLSIALGAADRAFWMSAFRSSLEQRQRAAEANNEWTGRPTPEDIEAAYADAARAIFQDKNAVSQGLSKIRGGLNWLSTLGATDQFGLGTALLAFTQVPGSILVRGAFDWSPLGFMNAAYQSLRPTLFKATGGRIGGDFDQRAFATAFGEALAGTTGLVGAGFWLASMGILTASGDDDEDVNNAMKAQRLGNYRINASALKRMMMGDLTRQETQDGDLLVSYDWAQPLAIAVAGGAEMFHQQDVARRKGLKTGITPSSLKSTFVGAVKSLEEQPLLSGLSSFAKTWGYSGWFDAAAKTALSLPSMFIPQAVRKAAQYLDNTARETKAGDTFTRPWIQIAAGIPGLSDNLPARIDVTGQAMERFPDGGNTLFNLMLNPVVTSRVRTNPVLQEATRLLNVTGDANAFPRQAGRTVTINGKKVELTNEQITRHNYFLGNMTMAMLTYRMGKPSYQRASDEEKAKMFVKDLNDVAAATRAGVYGLGTRDLSPAQKWIYRNFMKLPVAQSEPPRFATPPQ